MHKLIGLLLCCSSLAWADPEPQLTPAAVMAQMPKMSMQQFSVNRWLQAPLNIGGAHLVSNSANGGDETELNLTVSLNNQASRAYLDHFESFLQQRQTLQHAITQWQIAGELRRSWATLDLLSQQRRRLEVKVEKLRAMVAAATQAFAQGEITRVERLLLENAFTDASAQLSSITAQLLQTTTAYQQLTGLTDWPAHWHESQQAQNWQQHPLLLLQQLDMIQAEQHFVRESSGDTHPWQLGAILRKTAGNNQIPDETAIGLQISLPIGSGNGFEQSALSQQNMHQQQTRFAEITRQLRQQWFEAKARLDAAVITQQSAMKQAAIAREIQTAADEARAQGELTQTDWLRLFLQNDELMTNAELAVTHHALAVAELNQAGGLVW
jgi:outer membrane protein TolC